MKKILKDKVTFNKGLLSFSYRDYQNLLKLSGSKAKTEKGKRKAVRNLVIGALRGLVKEHSK